MARAMKVNRAAVVDVPAVDAREGVRARVRQEKPLAQRLDRVIHDRTRLAILSALAASETLAFNELKAITGTTDGNLSVHARKLEDAGYVQCDKSFAGRVPRTEFRLTTSGRRALEKYLDHMESLIKATRDRKPAGKTGTSKAS